MSRVSGCLLFLLLFLVAAFLLGRDYVRRHPQDVPWTRLELRDPTGRFTAAKIAALGDDPGLCRAMLEAEFTGDLAAPGRTGDGGCGYGDGMRLAAREGARSLDYRPAPLVTSCPVATALYLWESRVVQPAAQRHLGAAVERMVHAGSYSCRRIYGRDTGRMSQHSTADAVDITGFELENGGRVSVVEDWGGPGPKAAFLREVRDGACRLFSTVLSPDYNEAHRDHLHFDVEERGSGPWTLCR